MTLTDAQVAQYLRAKAQRYLDLAAELEFPAVGASAPILMQPIANGSIASALPSTPLTFEFLMKELDHKAGRVKHVAKRLGASEKTVRDLINTPNSRYQIANRGWIKPKA